MDKKSSITEIKAKDIMSRDVKSIEKTETLNRAISTLNNERIHNLIVYENGTYAGIFGYKQLVTLHRRPPDDTKIDSFTFKPPIISEDANIIDIVEQMYRLNYKIMPVGTEKKISGIVSERDILNAILNYSILSGKKVKDFTTPDPTILTETDTLGKAIATIREHNISRIPIIDKNNKLSGIIESLDLIRKLSTKEQYGRDSGTSETRSFSTPHGYISDIISDHDIAVKSLMSTRLVIAKPDDILTDKIKENINLDTSTIIITDDNDYPVGIIAPKDIIQFLAAMKEKERQYIQISGLEDLKNIDEFQKLEIHRMLDKTVQKVSNVSKINNFTIHAKGYHAEGNKTKYTFRCKFTTDAGLIFAKNWGWDPIDTFSTLMEEIDKITLKLSKKHTDKRRSISRDTKYSA
ncbi:MAG: CBS domain-containing protein [archaeon]